MEQLHPVLALALAPFAPPKHGEPISKTAPAVVVVLVEDVRYRVRRHGFTVTDRNHALALAEQSAKTLGLKPTAEELEQAASRLL